MIDMTPSIFSIERRNDFSKDFTAFYEDLINTEVIASSGSKVKMINYLEYCLRYWPYRRAAVNINDYLLSIEVDMRNPKTDTDLILILELLINLLHYAETMDMKDRDSIHFEISWGATAMSKEAERFLQNAEYILEQSCNMKVRMGEYSDGIETPQYFITKRDAFVDATVEMVPELAEILLGYLDIRNKTNRRYKENALIEIYKYIEPRRNEFKKGIAGSVSEEFFAAMNKFEIRHSEDRKVKLHYKKRDAVYDKLFRMGLFVIQSDTVVHYKDEVKKLRNMTDSQ